MISQEMTKLILILLLVFLPLHQQAKKYLITHCLKRMSSPLNFVVVSPFLIFKVAVFYDRAQNLSLKRKNLCQQLVCALDSLLCSHLRSFLSIMSPNNLRQIPQMKIFYLF